MRRARWVVALVWVASACTSSTSTLTTSPATTDTSAVVTTLADGTTLPEGCSGNPTTRETVAFVAGGRAWALDPVTLGLDCLFAVSDPGAFAWGPQGDRVLLGGGEIRGLTPDAPVFPAIGQDATAFDWGHPIGLAVVFADAGGAPRKRFMDDGRVEPLPGLPAGRYLRIAYHPSGLALAFVLERDGRQSVWLSRNDGTDPSRLVFSKSGTTFPSIAFSSDGQRLWWIGEHAQGYPEMHAMDLANRSDFTDEWRGPDGSVATDLRVSPDGRRQSADAGTGCADRKALVIAKGQASLALPSETRPTAALGWLDSSTLLVAAGGCGNAMDLFAVHARGSDAPTALAQGVDVAAPRTVLEDAPTSVPAPSSAEPAPPPGGVG